MNQGQYTEYSFEETYPDGSKHYCGVSYPTLKQIRNVISSEQRWLKEQIKIHKNDEQLLKLRQSQLDSIRIVSRIITISEWK